jgi:hypothetical protein
MLPAMTEQPTTAIVSNSTLDATKVDFMTT